jgi:putative transposase
VVHKYCTARNAMLESIKVGTKKVKYPYKEKRYYVTGWDYQSIKVNYNQGIIYLSKNEINDKKQRPIKCFAKTIPINIKQIELIFRNKFILSIKYIDTKEYEKTILDNIASIDLGEIHSIVSIDNNQNAMIITGRKIRSIKRLRNKKQAEIRTKMSKCTKGSKKYKKYLRALNKTRTKSNCQIRDCVHKITKLYVDYCLKNQISTIYYGDLDGTSRSTKQNNIANKMVRQKLSQWNFGEIIRELQNKLTRHGIKLFKIKEYYTSQKCPCCNKLNKPKKRNYKCKCGYRQHRDIVGAINILNDNTQYCLNRFKTFKYLQIA